MGGIAADGDVGKSGDGHGGFGHGGIPRPGCLFTYYCYDDDDDGLGLHLALGTMY
jgi:hypothetical protein